MTLNEILLWMIGASLAVSFIRAVKIARHGDRSWAVRIGVVGLFVIAAWCLVPEWAGFIAAALMAPIILVNIGFRALTAAQQRRDLRAVLRWAGLLRWAPLGWVRSAAVLNRAAALAELGKLDEAEAMLTDVARHDNASGRLAHASLLRLQNRWPELQEWFANVPQSRDPNLLPLRLRCLAETGNVDAMAREFVNAVEHDLFASDEHCRQAVVVVLAFTGRDGSLERLLPTMTAFAPETHQAYWQATAAAAAGRREEAERRLDALDANPTLLPAIKRALVWRRSHLPPAAAELSDPERLHVEAAAKLAERLSAAAVERPVLLRAWATGSIIVVLILVYVFTTLRQGEWMHVLVRFGALDTQRVLLLGEWWRLMSANLLHFNAMHLGMNLLGLQVLGGALERDIGRWRFIAIYVVSGLGCCALVVAANAYGFTSRQLMVGASGSIMGLLGANIASAVRGWRAGTARGDRQSRQRLRTPFMILGLQVLFDLSHPAVSMTGHWGGLLTGFALMLALWRKPRLQCDGGG
jgi:rhomboid protease GluP